MENLGAKIALLGKKAKEITKRDRNHLVKFHFMKMS